MKNGYYWIKFTNDSDQEAEVARIEDGQISFFGDEFSSSNLSDYPGMCFCFMVDLSIKGIEWQKGK